MAKIKYATWKKAFWEGFRAFGGAFVAVILAQLSAGIDVTNWQSWLASALVAAIAAGLAALSKWVRETYGKGDYTKLMYKLPL